MRLLVLAAAILTTYLLGRRRYRWVEPAAGPAALIVEPDWDDWYSEPVPMAAWAAGRN